MMACALTDFARPGLAEDRQRLALVQVVGQAVDGVHHAVAGTELDLEVAHLEQVAATAGGG
jgi:hypothetical protein